MAICLRSIIAATSNPSEAAFAASSSAVSSKAMNAPGSPKSRAPRAMNSIASSVLPEPAPPHTRVGRQQVGRTEIPDEFLILAILAVHHLLQLGFAVLA